MPQRQVADSLLSLQLYGFQASPSFPSSQNCKDDLDRHKAACRHQLPQSRLLRADPPGASLRVCFYGFSKRRSKARPITGARSLVHAVNRRRKIHRDNTYPTVKVVETPPYLCQGEGGALLQQRVWSEMAEKLTRRSRDYNQTLFESN